jgi:hypothetical protein
MKTHSLPGDLQLTYQAIYSLADAAGVQIACREGTVWLTLDGDPRDIVLEAGEAFTTPEHRHALVYALQPSRISLATAGQLNAAHDRNDVAMATPRFGLA